MNDNDRAAATEGWGEAGAQPHDAPSSDAAGPVTLDAAGWCVGQWVA